MAFRAYIRIDPRFRYLRQQAVSQFKGALKEAERRLQESRWKEALDRESECILNFLSNWEPSGQGLVVFSYRPENLWESLSLQVMVRIGSLKPHLYDRSRIGVGVCSSRRKNGNLRPNAQTKPL
ncbi:MAG: hypothetical protein ACREQW_25625 [Candidatus Binatia bacterium]